MGHMAAEKRQLESALESSLAARAGDGLWATQRGAFVEQVERLETLNDITANRKFGVACCLFLLFEND